MLSSTMSTSGGRLISLSGYENLLCSVWGHGFDKKKSGVQIIDS
jgi:hypothetical protein